MIAAYAPRSLNEPVGCSDSGLTSSGGLEPATGISGVRTATPLEPRSRLSYLRQPISPDPSPLIASPVPATANRRIILKVMNQLPVIPGRLLKR